MLLCCCCLKRMGGVGVRICSTASQPIKRTFGNEGQTLLTGTLEPHRLQLQVSSHLPALPPCYTSSTLLRVFSLPTTGHTTAHCSHSSNALCPPTWKPCSPPVPWVYGCLLVVRPAPSRWPSNIPTQPLFSCIENGLAPPAKAWLPSTMMVFKWVCVMILHSSTYSF